MNMILYRHFRGIHFYIYCYKAITVGRTRPNSSPPSRTRTLDLLLFGIDSEDSKDFVPRSKFHTQLVTATGSTGNFTAH